MGEVADAVVTPYSDVEADAPFTRHRFDVHAFERMFEVGILRDDERLELVEGEIVVMSPIGDDHAGTVNYLTQRLVLAFGERAIVAVQNPVRLDRWSQPQPDFAVLRARPDFYRGGKPMPADVLVLIEVADSSVRYDRGKKGPLYARHGVAEYWIVNLDERVVEVFRDPGPQGFATVTRHGPHETIAPLAAPEVLVNLAMVIG